MNTWHGADPAKRIDHLEAPRDRVAVMNRSL